MKPKKIIWTAGKIIWLLIGAFILLWTIFFYIKMHTIGDLSVIAVAVLFAAGIYMLAIFLAITILILIIKFITKLIKRKRKKKKIK